MAELIKEINKESLTTYKSKIPITTNNTHTHMYTNAYVYETTYVHTFFLDIKISDTEYEATMVINSPLDLSLDKCMKGSDPWILQSNKPARIFFVLLQQIDYLNKKRSLPWK